MKKHTILVSLLASGSMLFGQSATSSVEGQLVNAATGAPVKHATVTLRMGRGVPAPAGQAAANPGANVVETDEQGRFALRNLPPGGYWLTAQRQGYLDQNQNQGMRSTDMLIVGENQKMTGLTLRLTPHAVISGKVFDIDGDPIAGVQVYALRSSYVNGKRQQVPGGMGFPMNPVTTNDLGEYRIAGLAADTYFVMAGPPRSGSFAYGEQPPPPDKPELAYVSTFYPGATSAATATPVKVTSGADVRGTDIKLVKTKTVTIRGRIIDSGAPENRSAFVGLIPREAGGFPFGSTGSAMVLPGGAFQISAVTPGSYYLMARRSDDHGQVVAGGGAVIEVGEKNLDGITVEMRPAVDVEGIVKSDPPGRCGGGFVSLLDESGSMGMPGANISSDSKFTLKNVYPGTYTLNLPNNGTCWVESVRFGGREMTGARVRVDGAGPLEITMAVSQARVEGKVADSAGKPVEAALVSFLAKDETWPAPRTGSTSRTGGFIMTGLRPGAYEVLAFENVDLAAAQSPEYVKQFADHAKSITVQDGSHQSVQLTVIPASATGRSALTPMLPHTAGSVEGTVVNAVTGAPLAAATVILGTNARFRPQLGTTASPIASGPGGPWETSVETDGQGRFTIPDVPPDFYYISAERQGFTATSSDRPNGIGSAIVVGNGQRITGYTIPLSPQSVIAGKVTDEFGEAVSTAQAVLYRAEYAHGSRRMIRLGAAQTDDLGKFRLFGMPPGSYYLAIIKRSSVRLSQPAAEAPATEPGVGFGMVWYPNSLEAAGARPIAVGAAAEIPLDMVMRRTKLVHIRGTVTDGEGAPASRPEVALSPHELGTAGVVGSLSIKPDGEFEIANVPAGSYLLSARTTSTGPATNRMATERRAFLRLDVGDQNVEGVQLNLVPARQVHGTVKADGGTMPFAFITASAPEGLAAQGNSMQPGGEFTLGPVWPLTYAIEAANMCPTCYLKSVRYAGRDVPEQGIEFQGEGELELAISPAGAALDGVALDPQRQPAPGASVTVTRAGGFGHILSGKADEHGAFHFAGLRPGVYRVYAWEGGTPEISPDALAPFQSRATTVTLEENGHEKTQVTAIKR
jgi:hypothetical protein